MKFALSLAAIGAFSVSGCALFQGQPSKFDQVKSAVECRLELLAPYSSILTEDNLIKALAGDLDVVETLKAMDVSVQDIQTFVAGYKQCDLDFPLPKLAK